MNDAAQDDLVVELSGVTLPSPTQRRGGMVRGLNWRICRGDFWVVTTTQYAGQRELLFTAAGLQKPEAGRVVIFGQDTSDLGETRWFKERLQIGVVFEHGGRVLGDMSVAENISLGLRYHRDCRFEDVETEIVQILDAAGLGPYANSTPGAMSPGWQQRVALARALALRPHLFFFEKPLAHLEWQHRNWWMSFIPRLAAGTVLPGLGPATIVVITDDARPWEGIARQFGVLQRNEWRIHESLPDLDPDGWLEESDG
jgi:ABC-type transporter Mla maintaining outer membrane lipid asymmetry ATPase subunit MlaF